MEAGGHHAEVSNAQQPTLTIINAQRSYLRAAWPVARRAIHAPLCHSEQPVLASIGLWPALSITRMRRTHPLACTDSSVMARRVLLLSCRHTFGACRSSRAQRSCEPSGSASRCTRSRGSTAQRASPRTSCTRCSKRGRAAPSSSGLRRCEAPYRPPRDAPDATPCVRVPWCGPSPAHAMLPSPRRQADHAERPLGAPRHHELGASRGLCIEPRVRAALAGRPAVAAADDGRGRQPPRVMCGAPLHSLA